MSRIKILSPKVERYGIIVSVPLNQKVLLVTGLDIYEAEENFIKKRDNAIEYDKKVELDRVRALLNFAACCGAQLEKMNKEGDELFITLSFYSQENLADFEENMVIAISSSMMK